LQADGKIIVGGSFNSIDGITQVYNLARLNTNGTVDWAFTNTALGRVFSIAMQGDGKILIGSAFHNTIQVVRLLNDPATQTLAVPDASRVRWMRGGSSPEAVRVTFEVSTNSGSTWALLGAGARISGGWELTGLALPAQGKIRARAQVAAGGDAAATGAGCSFGLVETTNDFSGVSQPPSASLQIQSAPGGVSLLWATNLGDYVAQANWVVSDPNGWADLTNAPVTNGFNYSIFLSATNVSRFFRLRLP
jgi:hypothetical protein